MFLFIHPNCVLRVVLLNFTTVYNTCTGSSLSMLYSYYPLNIFYLLFPFSNSKQSSGDSNRASRKQ